MRRKEGQAERRLQGRGLTKALSSLGRGDGGPCFGRLPFGRVNTDPERRGRAARCQTVKGNRKVRKTKNTQAEEEEEEGDNLKTP